ncbi:MAG: hypothetical protein MHM6MM_006594 [Cercozoa sp. M6MM]
MASAPVLSARQRNDLTRELRQLQVRAETQEHVHLALASADLLLFAQTDQVVLSETLTSMTVSLTVVTAITLVFVAHVGVVVVALLTLLSIDLCVLGDKMQHALSHMGAAVSTFLGVLPTAFSQSNIFVSFFKLMTLVLLGGTLHGLLLLPSWLSFVGPVSHVIDANKEETQADKSSTGERVAREAESESPVSLHPVSLQLTHVLNEDAVSVTTCTLTD